MWTRAPDGTIRQASATGSSASFEGLLPRGDVVFSTSVIGTLTRFLTTVPYLSTVNVGSSEIGSVIVRDGEFVVLIGRSAFSIVP